MCFISYSYNLEHKTDHNFNVVNNYDFLQNCSYIFASTDYERKVLIGRFFRSKIKKGYPRIVSIGFTRFDLNYNKTRLYENKPFTILYTPRWTSYLKKDNEGSSFLQFIKCIIDYARHNSGVRIIIRPHPLMFMHYINNNIVEPDYFEKLEDTFSKLGNIYLDKSSDYMDSLNKADIFLSDYTSLLVEYFISGKPVIYSGSLKPFNYKTKKMCKGFYNLNKWEQIETKIRQLRSGIDPLSSLRKKLFPEIIKDYGNASRNILETLIKDFNAKGKLL